MKLGNSEGAPGGGHEGGGGRMKPGRGVEGEDSALRTMGEGHHWQEGERLRGKDPLPGTTKVTRPPANVYFIQEEGVGGRGC